MPHQNAASDTALPTTPFTLAHHEADEAAMTRLAFQIANRAVIEDIESYGAKVVVDARIYWDTRPMLDPNEHAPQSIDMATEAIQYAVGAGLVGLHPVRPYLVTIHGRS